MFALPMKMIAMTCISSAFHSSMAPKGLWFGPRTTINWVASITGCVARKAAQTQQFCSSKEKKEKLMPSLLSFMAGSCIRNCSFLSASQNVINFYI